MRNLIGRTLGHYCITAKVGEGGMGEVYRAHDERLDRDVAIKVLPEAVSQDTERLARFEREAKAVAALSHPSILEIFGFDTDGDVTYAVTELLEGETLREHLEQEPGQLPWKRIQEIGAAVASGLGAAHSKGVVHRDIKPSNIFLCADGRVKILDFGLARDFATSAEDQSRSPTKSIYTDPGAMIGTVGYMSPEQVRGEPADHRSDIFAVGCTLYEAITGQRAFRAGSAAETMANILNEEPEPISKFRDDVTPQIVGIVNRALQKSTEDRYQRVSDLADDLEAARRQIEEPRITLGGWLKRRRKVVAVCLAAVVVGTASTAVFIRHKQQRERIAAIISSLQPAVESGRFDEVFAELNRQSVSLAEVGDEAFSRQVAGTLSIDSEPDRAAVSLARVVAGPELSLTEAEDVGRTPMEGHLLVAGEYFVRLTTEGRPPVELLVYIDPERPVHVLREFVAADSTGMTRVDEGPSLGGATVPAFLIDRREVTNQEYFQFVAAGGYREPSHWPESVFAGADATGGDSPMTLLVDQTGLNGPRFWSNGKYADGKEDHPVVGISWYEAAAYARWAGKELPTGEQWWRAAVGDTGTVFPWGNDVRTVHLRANFGMRGTRPTGALPLGMSPFGCFDMAGNVREWLAGSELDGGQRSAVGGSWKEPSYVFGGVPGELYDAGFRSDAIGLRCVKRLTGE